MDVFETMKNRQSIRKFRKDPVQREHILRMAEAASWAPTAGNSQNFRFIAVQERETIDRMLCRPFIVSKTSIRFLLLLSYFESRFSPASAFSHSSARDESSWMAVFCPATCFERASTSPASLDDSRFDEAYASRRASTSRTFAS
jgi:nitroreductase